MQDSGARKTQWCGVFLSPTEEVLSVKSVDGIVYSALPLIHVEARLAKNFWFKFEREKVVDYDAEIGKEVLAVIIEQDGGSYLGSALLFQKTSHQTGRDFVLRYL